MIKIEQQIMHDPEKGTRGDCVHACVASLFEMRLQTIKLLLPEEVYGQDLFNFTKKLFPFLQLNALIHCKNVRMKKDGENTVWKYDLPKSVDPPTDSFYIASRESPRFIEIDGPYKGQRGLHMVVMKGKEVVWDPHPKRDMGVGRTYETIYWTMK